MRNSKVFSYRFWPLVWLFLIGCVAAPPAPTTPGPAGQTAQAADKPYPKTPAEAMALKDAGQQWSNCEIRVYYNELVGEIAGLDAAMQAENASAEARAHAAFDVRHNARLTARAMMADPAEVELLRERDRQKYGDPDGPTFEMLVEKNRAKGMEGDAVFTAIVESSQRTDATVNQDCGVRSP